MISKFVCAMLLTAVFSLSAACGRENAVYEIEASSGAEEELSDASGEPGEEAGETGPQTIFVYVCGAVEKPGVYELPPGSRVYQAIAAAGGMSGDADEKSLNQAELLEDGQQITVWTLEEAAASPAAGGEEEAAGKINLNTASRESLMTLPGIGEAKAEAIMAYREEHGGFKTPEEIQQVEGIKEKVFEKIKDQIEV